jgi:hypothetical protein
VLVAGISGKMKFGVAGHSMVIVPPCSGVPEACALGLLLPLLLEQAAAATVKTLLDGLILLKLPASP